MFGIFPEEMPKTIEGESVSPASIVIDGFKESMTIPLTYWNLDDYRNSWLKSLKEGLANKNHAALVVSMYEPTLTNFVFTWVVYFEDDVAHVQIILSFWMKLMTSLLTRSTILSISVVLMMKTE